MKKNVILSSIAFAFILLSCSKEETGSVAPDLPDIAKEYIVATYAGTGNQGFKDGAAINAQFGYAAGLALDAQGNLYVADEENHRIRKISPDGLVTTLAGSGVAGFADGVGITAQFNKPKAVALDQQRNVYVADKENRSIRKITPIGVVSTLAGSPSTTQFSRPLGVAVDGQNTVYVADYNYTGGIKDHRILKVSPQGQVSTLAGGASMRDFSQPQGLVVNSQGTVYVADPVSNYIFKISAAGAVSVVAGAGKRGYVDATGDKAQFDYCSDIALDAQGILYVADALNNRIRRVSAKGVVTTIAGNGTSGHVEGPGAAARFHSPTNVTIDSQGNLYVTDYNNFRIRKLTVK
ncbi:NHL repeat-containing protein [Hymenobacter elongatus]|uniref:SMP-30/Gluconolactonase/LRE-like region domain-containing protein n=1 Tax=Hymenobacter elongatus TaxID=877208 RepID=A0A4Z0PFA8_9BACT|nr:NHL repeat-containing protein [Hymenobacter elongatus]TGE13805.1 hypothetical protein E5J99_18800 [Hymenobacter elongatus]